MGYKTISTDNSSWTGTSFADNVYINLADKVRVNTAAGNDSIYNSVGWYDTIDAGDGNDTIKSYRGRSSSLVGGAGADLISLSGDAANITVKGGTGNDVIYGDSAAQLFQYANGDGNDVIYNWSANDTLQLTSGGFYSRSTVGNDVVIEATNGNVTLKGAKGKTVNVKGGTEINGITMGNGDTDSLLVIEGGGWATIGSYTSRNINNTVSNKIVNGTAYNDTITNSGQKVTINSGAGNDKISNSYGHNSSIVAGAGNDSIYCISDYVTVYGGAGSDTISNGVWRSKIFGGADNDLISLTSYWYNTLDGGDGNDTIIAGGNQHSVNGGAGADKVSLSGNKLTVTGGTGNDTIYFGGNENIVSYANGDGNDVIYNWSANDTISITGGSYTRSTVGSDVVLKVGNGAVTLKGAKNTTVNVKGTLVPTTTAKPSIPSGAFTYNGHSYMLYYGLSSWEQAKSYCESRGGHLAVITSAGENTALFNYMKRAGYDSAYFGLSDASKEGTWTWTNGERVSYTNWASGEPNGGTYENYGMFYYKYSDGKWNDGNFAAGSTFYSGGKKIVDTNAFICEWDTVTSSTPATVGGVNVNNTTSNKTVNGTAYNDTIKNTGNRVTINSGAGNDTISNNGYIENISVSAGAGNDSIYTYKAKYVTVLGGDGNDTIFNNRVDYGKIYAGAGDDTINNIVYGSYIDGGTGNDRISLSGGYGGNTVVGGTGNDTIYGDAAAQFFRYASGDGNDVIYNWSANDTISITGGSYARSTVGSDVVLKVGSGAITLKGAKNSTVNVKGTLASGGGSTIPAPQPSGNAIYGTNGHDNLINASSRYSVKSGISIYGYDGNDTITNYGKNVYISGGAGNDKIVSSNASNVTVNGNDGHDDINVSGDNARIYCDNGDDNVVSNGSYSVVEGGNGNDYLRSNSGNNVSIYGGYGNDYIQATGNYNPNRNGFFSGGDGSDTIVTQVGNGLSISGGAGNDLIQLQSSRAACVIAYNSGDGNDTVTGFDGNDTLKVYGSYTRSTVGNDVVVKVGYGSITLKNAKNSTLNISNLSSSADLVGSADLASDDWISADDTNFVTGDTQIDSIVKPVTNYLVGNFNAASMSLTPKNNFLTFASKK